MVRSHWAYQRIRGYGCTAGVDLLPYQMALGISVRWFDGGPHLRLYIGPLKLYASVFRIWHKGPDGPGSGLDLD